MNLISLSKNADIRKAVSEFLNSLPGFISAFNMNIIKVIGMLISRWDCRNIAV